MPESVREIGVDAVRKSNIKTLDASHTNLEQISHGAFYHCQQLESVMLPNSLTHIGQGAFAGSKIREIHLPKALNDIGYRAFQECHQLEEIDLSETEIEDLSMNTFQGCKNLTKIKLPKNLKRLSPIELEPVLDPYRGEFTKRKTVFSFMCPNLTEVEFPEEFARENPKIVEEIQRQLESNKARITKEKTKEKKPDDLPKETVSYGEDE